MMAALGRPQPYRLQTSIPQVGLGPLVHKDGGRKAESQHLISLFFCTSILAGLPPHTFGALFLHFFCFCVFRSFFACFSLFFAFFFAFHSRHPQILVSQMLPGEVPRVCLSRPCHPPPSPAASPRHPVRNPAPAPRPPKPFPTCPVPAPAAQPAQLPTGPATKSRACKQLSFRAFVFQRLSQLTFTNGQIEKIRKIKKQRQRKKEREREREGVRASFVVAVDQSSHFFCTLVCFFWIAST